MKNKDDNSFYINANTINELLMQNIGINFSDIPRIIHDNEIHVESKQIEQFLQNKLKEENLELMLRIKSYENDQIKFTSKEEEENYKFQKFSDMIEVSRYHLNNYTLLYFKNYIKITKEKLITLYNLYNHILEKRLTTKDKLLLKQLDINIIYDDCINYNDLKRIATAITDNINILENKTKTANDLNTYLKFNISLKDLECDCLAEESLYPSSKLQLDNYYANSYGYISFSNNQIANAKRQEELNKKPIRKKIKQVFHI